MRRIVALALLLGVGGLGGIVACSGADPSGGTASESREGLGGCTGFDQTCGDSGAASAPVPVSLPNYTEEPAWAPSSAANGATSKPKPLPALK
jgi:hypothetical protein